MYLFLSLLIGGLAILITVVVHAIAYNWILRSLARMSALASKFFGRLWKIPLLSFIVLCVLLALFFDIWMWTFILMLLDTSHLHDIETGLYYTSTSFTTVGYGDVILAKQWRIMGTICAVNGMFLFGWSAAFIYEIMEKLYHDDQVIKRKWDR